MKRGLSVAELIRQGVADLLQSSDLIDPQARIKRALQVAGRFHSGKCNVSQDHDKHLNAAENPTS